MVDLTRKSSKEKTTTEIRDELQADPAALATSTVPGLVGGSNGALAPAGYVGESVGSSATAGTGGSAYSIDFSTAVTTADTTLHTESLDIGTYLVVFETSLYRAGAAFEQWRFWFTLGGTQVTINRYISDSAGGNYTFASLTKVITIQSNATDLVVHGQSTFVTSTGNLHMLNIVRIA